MLKAKTPIMLSGLQEYKLNHFIMKIHETNKSRGMKSVYIIIITKTKSIPARPTTPSAQEFRIEM
jgi:hypothetical protein